MREQFLPDLFVNTIYDIDLEKLKNEGISAFIFDIDNTLVTYDDPIPTKKVSDWLEIVKNFGFKIYIVSNNNVKRVSKFSKAAGFDYIGRATKPYKGNLKKACRAMSVKPTEVALVGDQLFTDVWGANRMNMYSILVNPISPKEDWFVKWKRNIEKRIMER